MKIKIIQTNKDLYAAQFSILDINDCNIGTLEFKGNIASAEGIWNGNIKGDTFSLNYITNIINSDAKFRPYSINVNNNLVGEIYQTTLKLGIFNKVDYSQLLYNNQTYNNYSMSLGKEGCKYSIYCDNNQIALIEKDYIIYDDLHNFDIYYPNEEPSLIPIIFCCHIYTLGFYKPGDITTKGITKIYNKTTNKFLKEKYNPKFKDSITN